MKAITPLYTGLSVAVLSTLGSDFAALSYLEPGFAPKPPPLVTVTGPVAATHLKGTGTLYSIGDPTPEEQLYVELINRARANPTAEAQIFRETTDPSVLVDYENWEVDLPLMQSQFAALGAA